MTTRQTHIFLIAAIIALAAAVTLTMLFSPPETNKVRDPGAALTIISLSSVSIERILEGFWTYIGLIFGNWWPFSAIDKQINAMASNLDSVLEPFYQQLTNAVEKAKTADNWTEEQYAAAQQDIEGFQQTIDQLKNLPPGSQQSLAMASASSQLISNLQQKYQTINTVATVADQSITSFAQLIVSPTGDNLGRRFISLFIGTLLGFGVAGIFGLDLMQAILTSALSGQPSAEPLPHHLGIVLTGLVMGLGSSPTHEALKVVQALKTSLQKS